MMSSIIRTESPNSDVVLCSFGLGVEHFEIPNGVRLDNGKDYKARDMLLFCKLNDAPVVTLNDAVTV